MIQMTKMSRLSRVICRLFLAAKVALGMCLGLSAAHEQQPDRKPQDSQRSGHQKHHSPPIVQGETTDQRSGNHPADRDARVHDADAECPVILRKPFRNRLDTSGDQRPFPKAQQKPVSAETPDTPGKGVRGAGERPP